MTLADELLEVLNDPVHMWLHALRDLPYATQRLFLTLALLPTPVSLLDLQLAYMAQEFERTEALLDSLRSLEDSFIVIGGPPARKATPQRQREIRFRNPSLEEFGYSYLNTYPDWLSAVLSRPTYFEQIAKAFDLASSRNDGGRRAGSYRYPEISAWVAANAAQLLSSSISLIAANVERPIHGRKGQIERLGLVLEFIHAYKPSMEPGDSGVLRLFIQDALDPSSQRSAEDVAQLVENDRARRLLDELADVNSANKLRTNLLDKDEWKYSILLRLDQRLGLHQTSMASWGERYISYAEQLVDDLTDCDDADTLEAVIRELEDMAAYLDVDLSTEINILQAGYDDIAPKMERRYDSYDEWIDEEYPHQVTDLPRGSTAAEKLDRLFESFLE